MPPAERRRLLWLPRCMGQGGSCKGHGRSLTAGPEISARRRFPDVQNFELLKRCDWIITVKLWIQVILESVDAGTQL